MPNILRKWVGAINSKDIDLLVPIMSAEHTFFVEGEQPTVGADANKRAWQGYFSAFPDYTIHIDTAYREGDTFYLLGHTSGSHVPPNLESIHESVIWKATLEAGSLAEWIIYDGTRRGVLGIPAAR